MQINAQNFGIQISSAKVNFPGICEYRNAIVNKLIEDLFQLFKKSKVEYIEGKAKVSHCSVRVKTAEGEEKFNSVRSFLATGSVSEKLHIPDLDCQGILTSNEAFELLKLPESIAILGGGVIACEFAEIFAILGAQVTILELLPHILPCMDRYIS
ncbi:MAG: FAD-dependent oxidoreductase [Eggerthellaceae bacterium]|nr:FAD-dependent oxidoreductase [Eggerthellaceae bacterium]